MNIIKNFEKIKQEIKIDSIRKNVEVIAESKNSRPSLDQRRSQISVLLTKWRLSLLGSSIGRCANLCRTRGGSYGGHREGFDYGVRCLHDIL